MLRETLLEQRKEIEILRNYVCIYLVIKKKKLPVRYSSFHAKVGS